MADGTAIEWTHVPGTTGGATWNTVRGCQIVSAGCQHCYAAALSYRYGGPGGPFEGLAVKGADGVPRFTGEVRTVPHMLALPFTWRQPRGIFVNSMADTFHARVPHEFVDRLFAVMALTPRHTYQVLTKRPLRAARYLADPGTPARVQYHAERLHLVGGRGSEGWSWDGVPWPLPNVWLGTSVEDNPERHRISALKRAPAVVHFLSCEPLIGPLELGHGHLDHIEWVIVGGESGANHRPCDREWARELRDQCAARGVPYFFKQWGGLTPKSGGRLLDGRTWDQFPAARVTA